MQLFRHHENIPESARGCVAALGNFDGLHRGHQVVIGEAGRRARAMGLNLTVISTEPHPRRYFRPDEPAFRLTPFRERAELMEQFGVDVFGVLPFDRRLANMAAQDFVIDVVLRGFGALHLVAGYDYRFGKGRGGGANVLSWMAAEEAFGLTVIEPVSVGIEGAAGETYSSTLIRNALREGRPRRAAALLGHWWSINGRVVAGDRRGRTIGFPTANIELADSILPAFGVYAVRARLDGQNERIDGVANIGVRPTFAKDEAVLEVHLFDFDGDIYDRHMRVELIGFIRPERQFDGPDALVSQISRDCHVARDILNDPDNAADRLNVPTLDDYLQRFPHPPRVLHEV